VVLAANDQSDAIATLLHSLAKLWPLWVLVALVAAAKLALWLHQEVRLRRAGIAEVDRMDGPTFERFLVSLFRRLDYRVEHTGRRGDFGADLVVAKGGRRTVVQAKCWKRNVGVGAVQEAVAAKGYYRCDDILVVTNRRYTEPAKKLARANAVTLWSRDELVAKLLAVGGAEATAVDTAAVAADVGATAPTARAPTAGPATSTSATDVGPTPAEASAAPAHCVTCGAVVSAKVRDYCRARPARSGASLRLKGGYLSVPSAL
jgi:restriction endonuclease